MTGTLHLCIMMTSSNGNIFHVTGPLCGEFTGLLFYLRLNKWVSKPSRRRWLETPSRSLWCHCDDSTPSHQLPPSIFANASRRRIPLTKANNAELWFLFFDLRLNERFSKQSWGWWFETPSRPLWRHCNVPKYKLALHSSTSAMSAVTSQIVYL